MIQKPTARGIGLELTFEKMISPCAIGGLVGVAQGVPVGAPTLGNEFGAAQWRRLLGLRASLARSKVAEVLENWGCLASFCGLKIQHFFQGKRGRTPMTFLGLLPGFGCVIA